MNWPKVKTDLLLAFSSNFVDKLVGYVILVLLTRYLLKDEVGALFFAAALAQFVAIFSDLGVNEYLFRAVAAEPQDGPAALSTSIALRLPLLVGCFLILNAIAVLFLPELVVVMLLTSTYVLLEGFSLTFAVYLLAVKRVGDQLLATLSARALLLTLIAVVIVTSGSLAAILACYVVANGALVGLGLLLVRRRAGALHLAWRGAQLKQVLYPSLPLFALVVLDLVHLKVDTLMLGVLRDYASVATYEAAFKILEVSRFLIRPVVMIFFPLAAGLAARREWERLRRLIPRIWVATGAGAAALTLVVALLAGPVISLLFGAAYDDAVPILRVLFLSVPALFLGIVSTALVNALHLERRAIRVLLSGVLANLILNGMAISRWGALGAAWTTVISETWVAVWLMHLVAGELRRGADRTAADQPLHSGKVGEPR